MSHNPNEENQTSSENTVIEEMTEQERSSAEEIPVNQVADESEQLAEEQGEQQEGHQEEESIESLKAALAAAELKLRDEALRAQAEIQNVRRRAERDVESAHKFGQEKLVKDLLAVVDSLERGIQAIDEQEGEQSAAVKTIKDGSELTLKMFLDTLARFHIKPIDPLGEPFDPKFHEALSMVPNPDAEPNSVMAVVQKGFTLHDRLIRPAMVVVVKPS